MPGKKVLVSGANGFIGAHVVEVLLKEGYHVRGTVRSQAKADQVYALYPQYKDQLEFVFVEDISRIDAFEGKLDGLDGVFHVASPFHHKINTSNKVDLLDPAINGTVGILKAASKVPSIKRVIITSSFAAIFNPVSGTPGHVYTEEDWNPVTYEEALTIDKRFAYASSKKLAEKAAWDFVKENKPHFDIATLCPPMVYGPIAHHIDKLADLGESAGLFYAFVSGKNEVVAPFLDIYADVRDLALAHRLAFETPGASNQRFLISNGNYDWQDVVDAAHKYFPDQAKAHRGTPGVHPPKKFSVDTTKSVTKLGVAYHPKEETLRDTITQLVELEKQGK